VKDNDEIKEKGNSKEKNEKRIEVWKRVRKK